MSRVFTSGAISYTVYIHEKLYDTLEMALAFLKPKNYEYEPLSSLLVDSEMSLTLKASHACKIRCTKCLGQIPTENLIIRVSPEIRQCRIILPDIRYPTRNSRINRHIRQEKNRSGPTLLITARARATSDAFQIYNEKSVCAELQGVKRREQWA